MKNNINIYEKYNEKNEKSNRKCIFENDILKENLEKKIKMRNLTEKMKKNEGDVKSKAYITAMEALQTKLQKKKIKLKKMKLKEKDSLEKEKEIKILQNKLNSEKMIVENMEKNFENKIKILERELIEKDKICQILKEENLNLKQNLIFKNEIKGEKQEKNQEFSEIIALKEKIIFLQKKLSNKKFFEVNNNENETRRGSFIKNGNEERFLKEISCLNNDRNNLLNEILKLRAALKTSNENNEYLKVILNQNEIFS